MLKIHRYILVGLSSENIPNSLWVGELPNSYAIQGGCGRFYLSGKRHQFEWPNGAIKPEYKGSGDVYGCGLLQYTKNEFSIFFTVNGILMGQSLL
jgi:hypothetical protein